MTTDEILSVLETDVEDPGSEKSGEYLEQHVLAHARAIAKHSRKELVEALRRWLVLRSLPRTLVAIRIAGILELVELAPDIRALRSAAGSGSIPKYYVRYIEKALLLLGEAT